MVMSDRGVAKTLLAIKQCLVEGMWTKGLLCF